MPDLSGRPAMEAFHDDARSIRRTMRDLVALSALPAMWAAVEPPKIAEDLADVLLHAVGPDFVYLRLRGQPDGREIEVARTLHGLTTEVRAEEVGRALAPWPGQASARGIETVPNPIGDGTVRIVILPVGFDPDDGVLVAGSRRADFPSEEDRLLLGVGANQAALVLQRRWADGALHLAHARLELAVSGSDIGIWEIEMPDGVYRNGRVESTNLVELLGYDRPELASEFAVRMTLVHPEDRGPLEGAIQAYLSGRTPDLEVEHRARHKDGSYRWMLTRGVAMRDEAGVPVRIVGSSIDISAQKQTEDALRLAKETAEAANRAKDEFLANVSHEIRTPFGAILGMTELVLETALTEDQRQCLTTAKSAAESLLGLVDDLLDFEKIEAGKLALDPAAFSIRAMLDDTMQTLAVRAQDKGLELAFHMGPDVPDALVGDAARLRQVLVNLIGNAIKFTNEGQVAVRVEVADGPAPAGEAVLRFAVIDTGIGVPPEGRQRIFQAFEQWDSSSTRRYGGTGLGLTIAARLVGLMGGEIGVESEPGRGSTFAFTARFGRPSPPPEQVSARPSDSIGETVPATDATPLRILVAEDSEFNARHLERLLTRRGHSVRVATNGREALDLATGEDFDVLLLDVHLPELDGFHVARAIRERATGGHLPVIALTARAGKEDRDRCLAAGMDDYLSKPVRSAELFAMIDRAIAHGAAPRSASPVSGGPADLLDPIVLLEACGGDAVGLTQLREDFRTYAPGRLAEVGDALRERDAPRLREAAHMLLGLLAAFSTVAGEVASELEDATARGRLDEARPLVERLEEMAQELDRQLDGLSIERLRRRAGGG